METQNNPDEMEDIFPEYRPVEKNLEIIATIVRILGIIGAIILFIAGLNLLDGYGADKTWGYSLLIAIIPLLISTEITHGVLRVLVNISDNIRRNNSQH
ncbi:hypothetical protein [uncultured Alistipes sp.]|uniref:hypothetical protein n=1 Tax=uncultured Alistipes sp. TaxID=538949 RepID=UPI0025946B19|nr:hypothetical protein [uncultured Alistipes sp.]